MNKTGWMFLVLLAIVAMPLWALAQQTSVPGAPGTPGVTDHSQHEQGTAGRVDESGKGGPRHHGMMMERCREMMAKQDHAKADIEAMDARLDEKVAAMNAAKGDQKTEAMSAVLNELISQRKEMRDKLGSVHHAKMCGMMGQMGHKGKMNGGMMHGKDGMSGCPMCPMMQNRHGGHEGHGQTGKAGEDAT